MRFLAIFTLVLFCGASYPKPQSNKKFKVLVIDTGVDLHNKLLAPYLTNFNPKGIQDRHGHGTHIMGLIASKACRGVEIIPCKGLGTNEEDFTAQYDQMTVDCFIKGIELDVDAINYSGGSAGTTFHEEFAINLLELKGTIVVAAVGNKSEDIDKTPFYPASFKNSNIRRVGSIDSKGQRSKSSSYGSNVYWEPGENVVSEGLYNTKDTMSGTSQSAAIYTSKLVEEFCRNK